MAHSYQRRWAELTQKYARLHERYKLVLNQRKILRDDLNDCARELREAKRELRDYQSVSKNTFSRYLASMRYAIGRLREAGQTEAAQKMEAWLEDVEDRVQPVVDIKELVYVLEANQSIRFSSNTHEHAAVYMRTERLLNEFRPESESTDVSELP